jgi:cell division protein FtsB
LERRIFPYLTIVLAIAVTACDRGAAQRAQAAETKLAQMNQVSAAKDSLTRELMATTSFMTDLNDELAKVKPAKGSKTQVVTGETVVPLEQYRAGMITKIKDMRVRIDENEKKLASTQARLRKLTANNEEMAAQIATFDTMVSSYTRIMEQQRTQIAVLTSHVHSLQQRVQMLNDENTHLSSLANTVYYILGTKKELMEKGIVSEVGGSRVLGIGWRTGETLVPGTALSAEAFKRLAKQSDLEIALPNPEKTYRLVSPQNLSGLQTKPEKDRTFKGTNIRITNPDAFWGPSKYLILVEG